MPDVSVKKVERINELAQTGARISSRGREVSHGPPLLKLEAGTRKPKTSRIDEAEARTAIVIAHRLATVRRVDVIFVVNEGRIVEKGTHGELLAKGGLYSHLSEIQFKPQEVEAEQEVVSV